MPSPHRPVVAWPLAPCFLAVCTLDPAATHHTRTLVGLPLRSSSQRADETYYFAYCFPYTYSYLQRFLFALESKQLPFLHRDCLCRSLQERRLDLLTISSPDNLRLDAQFQRGQPHDPLTRED